MRVFIRAGGERSSRGWLFLLPGMLFALGCRGEAPSTPSLAPPPATTPEQRQRSAALVHRGNQFLSDDLGSEAIRVLEEARRLDPASPEAALGLASAYRREDRFAASRKLLEEVLASGSTPLAQRVKAREALVEVLLDSGEVTAAREQCAPLPGEGEPSPNARRLAGLVAYRSGDLPGALRELKEAVRLAPRESRMHAALGLVRLQANDLAGAVGSLEEAVRLDPESQEAMSNLAKAYQRSGRKDSSREALDRYRAIYERKSFRQKVGPLRSRAMEAYDAGRLEEALAGFREVMRLTPRDAQALAQTGSVLLALQRLDEARETLERALQIQPADDFALTELARVHALRGELPAALDLLTKATHANPSAAEPHYFLAGIYLALGKREDFAREKAAYLRLRGPGDTLRPLPDGGIP
ncbi:MAG TPA: tetratricopeptide repeat protein [Candidatus Polarisedimenticolia bacterium]|nr:tetratricopeptide repeat protein [Candidatus Polarisedimenticolia bacterium]